MPQLLSIHSNLSEENVAKTIFCWLVFGFDILHIILHFKRQMYKRPKKCKCLSCALQWPITHSVQIRIVWVSGCSICIFGQLDFFLISEPTCTLKQTQVSLSFIADTLCTIMSDLSALRSCPGFSHSHFSPAFVASPGNPGLLSYCNAPSNVGLSWSCLKCIQIYPSQPITALSPLTPHTLGSVSVTNPLKIHHMI